MQNVILVVHILASIILTGLVLLQKSEGGGLGLGGGGGGANSILSGRGTAGALVRTTIMIGALFFVTSLTLTAIASRSEDGRSAVERALGAGQTPAPSGPADLFDPSAPLLEGQSGIPATPAETPDTTETPDLIDPTAQPDAATPEATTEAPATEAVPEDATTPDNPQ